jgi:hypothetical protein
MAGPVGDVLAFGQVVISSVKTLSGLKLSVTVRKAAPNPDISTSPEANAVYAELNMETVP